MMAAWRKKRSQIHMPVRPGENALFQADYSDLQGSEAASIARGAKCGSVFLSFIQNWLPFSPFYLPSAAKFT